MELSRYFYGKALDIEDFLAIRRAKAIEPDDPPPERFRVFRPPRETGTMVVQRYSDPEPRRISNNNLG